MLPLPRARVPYLFRELRSHVPCSVAKKKKVTHLKYIKKKGETFQNIFPYFFFKAVWPRGGMGLFQEIPQAHGAMWGRLASEGVLPPGGAGAAGIVAVCEALPYVVSPPGLCPCCAHPQGHSSPPMAHSDLGLGCQLTSSLQKILLIPPRLVKGPLWASTAPYTSSQA